MSGRTPPWWSDPAGQPHHHQDDDEHQQDEQERPHWTGSPSPPSDGTGSMTGGVKMGGASR